MGELNWFDLVVSFAFTWTVGLVPPLLIRYVILKSPVMHWPAIGICAFLWFANLLLFVLLGSQSKTHLVLLVIGLVSYKILQSPSSRLKTRPAAGTLKNEIEPDVTLGLQPGGGAVETEDILYPSVEVFETAASAPVEGRGARSRSLPRAIDFRSGLTRVLVVYSALLSLVGIAFYTTDQPPTLLEWDQLGTFVSLALLPAVLALATGVVVWVIRGFFRVEGDGSAPDGGRAPKRRPSGAILAAAVVVALGLGAFLWVVVERVPAEEALPASTRPSQPDFTKWDYQDPYDGRSPDAALSNLGAASDVNPDQQARINALAREAGVPPRD